MTSKKRLRAFLAACIAAIMVIALCGCEDLGIYEDVNDYYAAFGDIILIEGNEKKQTSHSVKDKFYNDESREDFLEGNDGAYTGVDSDNYIYMAIPVERDLNMDTFALYMNAYSDVSVYMSLFITNKVPENPKCMSDILFDENGNPILDVNGNLVNNSEPVLDEDGNPKLDENGNPIMQDVVYDDPYQSTCIADTVIRLSNGEWNSFMVDAFMVNGKSRSSIEIEKGQYILIQFRNNNGIRAYNHELQALVDEKTGRKLDSADFTMTNLLVRAIEEEPENEG